MKKGDCIILQHSEEYFAIILHHSTSKEGELFHGFIVVGDQYSNCPIFEEIVSSKVLGYKYINKASDLINSVAWISKEHNPSTLHAGIKYDLLTIPETLFKNESNKFQKIGTVEFHEGFFPRPGYHSRISNYEKLVKTISERVSKKDPSKIEWNRYYDAFELHEVLDKSR